MEKQEIPSNWSMVVVEVGLLAKVASLHVDIANYLALQTICTHEHNYVASLLHIAFKVCPHNYIHDVIKLTVDLGHKLCIHHFRTSQHNRTPTTVVSLFLRYVYAVLVYSHMK